MENLYPYLPYNHVRNKTIIGLKSVCAIIFCTRFIQVRNKTIIGLKFNIVYINVATWTLEIRL